MMKNSKTDKNTKIKLPKYSFRGLSVEEAILKRRSVREYSEKPLSISEVSHILFSAYGITHIVNGFELRASPSAGALYPIEIYFAAHNIEGINEGIYHYIPQNHSVEIIKKGNFREEILKACLSQETFLTSSLTIIYTAVFRRTTSKYGERGYMYIYIEVGHIAQNVALQCVSLGLSSCVVGAFYENKINKIIGVDGKEQSSIYIQTIGFGI